MKTKRKITFLLLFLIIAILALTENGFGQIKFITTENAIPNKYVVVLNNETYNDKSNLAVAPTAQDLANSYNGQLGFIYESAIKGFAIDMNEEDALALSQDEQVEYVIEDNEIYMTDTQTNAPWNLDRIDQRNLPLNTTYNYNATGAG